MTTTCCKLDGERGGLLLVLLKNFVLFYFLVNTIIVFIALKYDCPKDVIKQEGYWIVFKAIAQLFLGGIILVLIKAAKEF